MNIRNKKEGIFEQFKKGFENPIEQGNVGRSTHKWLKQICNDETSKLEDLLEKNKSSLKEISEKPVSRKDIYDMVANKEISNFACISSILAWGGMRINNALEVLSTINS